ncbi:enoyl-CoA hydratase-related protein [Burkholderiaceae bacterium UC74_6]
MAEQRDQAPSVEVRHDGPVRTLVLNRPAALNACTGAMLVQLREALESAAADSSVRCVLLTGAGRAFCAGQDLSDPLVAPVEGEAAKDLGPMLTDYYNPLLRLLRELPVPTVAAVNGVAAGSGANLALSCDFVLASEKASFIQAFSKIGLVPDSGGTWLLPRLVGRARALQLAMLGDKLPAAEAAAIGLIARCLPEGELMPEAAALAARLAAMPTKALVETRRAMDAAVLTGYADALDAEAVLQSSLGRGADYLEGVSAFQQKRAPVFTDR